MPALMLAVAAAATLYSWPKPAAKVAKKSAGTCQSRYCGPRNMFVDSAKNTLLKDQSLGVGLARPQRLPGVNAVFSKIQSDLEREQLLSPGVNLVAHTVA